MWKFKSLKKIDFHFWTGSNSFHDPVIETFYLLKPCKLMSRSTARTQLGDNLTKPNRPGNLPVRPNWEHYALFHRRWRKQNFDLMSKLDKQTTKPDPWTAKLEKRKKKWLTFDLSPITHVPRANFCLTLKKSCRWMTVGGLEALARPKRVCLLRLTPSKYAGFFPLFLLGASKTAREPPNMPDFEGLNTFLCLDWVKTQNLKITQIIMIRIMDLFRL